VRGARLAGAHGVVATGAQEARRERAPRTNVCAAHPATIPCELREYLRITVDNATFLWKTRNSILRKV
jgi:hypothetical protein